MKQNGGREKERARRLTMCASPVRRRRRRNFLAGLSCASCVCPLSVSAANWEYFGWVRGWIGNWPARITPVTDTSSYMYWVFI